MTEKDLSNLLRNVKLNSKKDHFVSDCPFCKKEGHFYLNRKRIFKKIKGRYISASDCKKCGETANLVKLLKKLDSLHLLDGEEILFSKKLRKLNEVRIGEEESESELNVRKRRLPTGFKRKFKDSYLEKRGFRDNEFGKYKVGRTKLLKRLDGYIIISIEENGICKGYLSRITLSGKEIRKIEKDYKEKGIEKKVLRYKNSKSDFSKLVLGLDEIRFNTEWVIIVEGFFDKVNVDIKLGLDDSSRMKCVSTFGKSISKIQIEKLKRKGVEKVILIQDEDAIKTTRKHVDNLVKEFDEVLVGYVKQESGSDLDLGDCNEKQINEVFDTLMKPNIYKAKILRKL